MPERAEKIEKEFIAKYGYSPDYVHGMADNFESLEQMIDHYMDFAGSLEQCHRLTINKISFKKNRIKIMLAKVLFLNDKLMNAVLVEETTKKKAKADGKEAEKLLAELEGEIAELLEETKNFIGDLEHKVC